MIAQNSSLRAGIGISLAALILTAITVSGVTGVFAAPKQRDFIIANGDGYGTHDCLATQGQCGRLVADAWCESKGFTRALAYRQLDRDEVTGSTSPKANGKPVESFLISCQE